MNDTYLTFSRRFSAEGRDPYQFSCGRPIAWARRTAHIEDEHGHIKYHAEGLDFPEFFSDNSVNVASYQYFSRAKRIRENSFAQLVKRVTAWIAEKGVEGGYFRDENAAVFQDELIAILVNQIAAFNSPVWYNVGIAERPQASACFIQRVEDTIDGERGLMELQANQSRLFKGGSGTGSNFTNIRSSKEGVSGGGIASGPVSFMEGYDAWAGTIRSGGKTRRAAMLNRLDASHPDIRQFIGVKPRMEELARGLEAGGACDPNATWDDPEGSHAQVRHQNANHTVGVTDAFMRAVEADGPWELKAVTTGKTLETLPARALFEEMVDAAWACADPGLQFHDTINRWNTVTASGEIRCSNPCGEYVFLDDSACNLASINILKFLSEDGTWNLAALDHTIRILITAMEILCEYSAYPTEAIDENSHAFRPLGLGYGNVGAALMCSGLAYDSDEGRRLAAGLTAYLTARAYSQSAKIARVKGPFAAYEANRDPMQRVLRMHGEAAARLWEVAALKASGSVQDLCFEAVTAWNTTEVEAASHGVRNAQVSLFAPTGTIAFLMGCATTGIEPDYALVKYKQLATGGMEVIVNHEVGRALKALGYTEEEASWVLSWVRQEGTPVGCFCFKEEHAAVFDTAVPAARGGRFIDPMGHVRMMAAVQPFISGAISKTVNLPSDATREEIAGVFTAAWKMGLKGITVYRDGCKGSQPLSAKKSEAATDLMDAIPPDTEELRAQNAALQTKVAELTLALEALHQSAPAPVAQPEPVRRRLPKTRRGITHKGTVGGQEFYFTVGLDEGGQPRELFTNVSKAGSTLNGFCEVFGILVSMLLQYNVPLTVITNKLRSTRFDPQGWTDNADIRKATSIPDYIVRWLDLTFPEGAAPLAPGILGQLGITQAEAEKVVGEMEAEMKEREAMAPAKAASASKAEPGASRPCGFCGQLVRKNACSCPNCGTSLGCSG